MTSSCNLRLARAVVLLAALLEFSMAARAESLSAIFTNVAPAARPAIPRRASILFIQCDGLGYGDLSCYGQVKFQTPNLDRLAAEGMRFTNYFAGDAESSPACATLLLGKAANQVKQRADADVPLAAEDITVAQILKNSGYQTGLIGQWNLGDENSSGAPWKKGFVEFAGYLNAEDAENYYADYMFRCAPKGYLNPTTNQREDYLGREMLYPNTGGKKRPVYSRFAHQGCAELRQNQPARQVQPFLPVFSAAQLHRSAPGENPAGADRRAVFRGAVAATGKKQGRRHRAARRLRRAIAGPIAKNWHDQQRRGFFHERHRAEKIRRS